MKVEHFTMHLLRYRWSDFITISSVLQPLVFSIKNAGRIAQSLPLFETGWDLQCDEWGQTGVPE
jgi:hypothetical protein